jgi:pimeloyl-ACP methyl ester carboxylesterase
MSLLVAACLFVAQAAIPEGNAKRVLDLDTARIEVFTYKPARFTDGPMLMVFHGVLRNADEYRDHARAMGDRFGMLIVAPRFDEAQFGPGMYQQGGLFQGGELAPRSRWTWNLVPKIADQIRRAEGRPDMPYYLIGHSGGAQFVLRLSAFVPTDAKGIVAANPGTDLFATRDFPYPYGFGGLPNGLGSDEQLRAYLAQPLTLYLGTGDTERDSDLDKSEEADSQGPNRYQRGLRSFRIAEKLAREKGWTLGWRLVEAPGIGHDHQAMFDAPACRTALFGAK